MSRRIAVPPCVSMVHGERNTGLGQLASGNCKNLISKLSFHNMSFREPDEPDETVPAPEPGSAENPLLITDPRAMRALAHPARIAILQHLVVDGPATATECAEIAGLSPSACSYHLRALA